MDDTIRQALARENSPEDRVQACRILATRDDAAARTALIRLASNLETDETVAKAAGEAVALQHWRGSTADDLTLADFTEGAYLAFDETIANLERT